jgi:microcystin-dependent protein
MDGVLAFTTLFAGSFAPKNWALCQGQLMPISQNTALFSLIGTYYGGNGVSNFALPDLRGRGVIGAGSNIFLGEMGGSETTTMITTQMPAHAHDVVVTPKAGSGPTTASPKEAVYATSNNNLFNFSTSALLAPFVSDLTLSNTGSGQPFSNLQPVLGLNYIICLSGLFPARN